MTQEHSSRHHTYFDGVRVQGAGVVSSNVILVARPAENATANQADPEVVGSPALLFVCRASGPRAIASKYKEIIVCRLA